MKQNVLKQITLLLGLAGSISLVACNGGSNVNSTTTSPVVDNSPLAQFKGSLTYTPSTKHETNSNALNSIGETKQQSFIVPDGTTLNLSKVRVILFGSSDCVYGSESAVVVMDGGNLGVTFNSGIYTSSNVSNAALYQKFAATLGNTLQDSLGVRFDYQYNADNGGSGWVSAGCMASGLGNYESTPAPCTAGSACGFQISQVESLPTQFLRAIFVTSGLISGNMAYYDKIGHDGYNGANNFCMSDAGKPSRGAGSTWRALLVNNNSTESNQYYYRSDYATSIVKATGNNLVGFYENLTNNISSTNNEYAWTGFTPTMDSTESGWTQYGNGPDNNNCANWTSDNSLNYGIYGYTAGYEGASEDGSPNVYNFIKWAVDSANQCSNYDHLYCVQQSN